MRIVLLYEIRQCNIKHKSPVVDQFKNAYGRHPCENQGKYDKAVGSDGGHYNTNFGSNRVSDSHVGNGGRSIAEGSSIEGHTSAEEEGNTTMVTSPPSATQADREAPGAKTLSKVSTVEKEGDTPMEASPPSATQTDRAAPGTAVLKSGKTAVRKGHWYWKGGMVNGVPIKA